MADRMAGGGHGLDAAVIAQAPAVGKPAERATVEVKLSELDPARDGLAEQPLLDSSRPGPGEGQIWGVDKDRAAEVHRAVDVVAMHVGENHTGNISQPETGRSQSTRQFLLHRDVELGKRDVADSGGLARVHQPEPLLVLDRPAVDGQGLRPLARQEQVNLTAPPQAGVQEGVLEPDRARPQRVDPHGAPVAGSAYAAYR